MYTIWQWVVIVIVALILLCLIGTILAFQIKIEYTIVAKIGTIIACIIPFVLMCYGFHWYNTSTASGIRSLKDFKSNLSNGIEREITITAEDGRQIFHYEGKVDVESNHVDNYIKFESEQGKRYLIYYGVQDTISIIEK